MKYPSQLSVLLLLLLLLTRVPFAWATRTLAEKKK